jgi:predicted transcriptional regulator
MKNTTITLRISEQEKSKLTEFAEKKDISVSQLIREAVKQYLEKINTNSK